MVNVTDFQSERPIKRVAVLIGERSCGAAESQQRTASETLGPLAELSTTRNHRQALSTPKEIMLDPAVAARHAVATPALIGVLQMHHGTRLLQSATAILQP